MGSSLNKCLQACYHPGEQTNPWSITLKRIASAIQISPENESNLLSPRFISYLLKKYYKFYFNKDQKLQLLQNLIKLFKINQGQQQVTKNQNQMEFCGQMAQRFHQLQNKIYFKHRQSLGYLKFIANEDKTDKKENDTLQLPNLLFQMDQEEVEKVAALVRTFCQQDMNAFAFLSLYFRISVQNRLTKDNLSAVQQLYLAQLKNLQRIYPASTSQIDSSHQGQQLNNIPYSSEPKKLVFDHNQKSHLQQLKEFINRQAQKAKLDKKTFQNHSKGICYEYGYGFKSGVKIKNSESETSIMRTVQKLMDKPKYQEVFEKFKKVLTERRLELEKEGKTLDQFVHKQVRNVESKIKDLLESLSEIEFDAKDLVRGKCIFNKVDQIKSTASKLIVHGQKQHNPVIQLKNRLNKGTKDVTLINQMPNSISQLQLVLKLDSVSNQFNHKIYELLRSTMYTPITNLCIQNKKWCQDFFTQQIQLFEYMIQLSKQPDLKENVCFNDFKRSMKEFIKKNLKKNNLECEKSFIFKEDQNHQIEDKFHQLLNLIESQKTNNVNKVDRALAQQCNEIRFFSQSFQYEEALKLISNIPDNKLQSNSTLLILKGDILQKQGLLLESINCYLKSITLLQKQKKDSIELSNVLHQIGQAYWSKGDFNNSLKNYEKCLQIKNKMRGSESIEAADTLHNIGNVYSEKGDESNALKYLEKALKIRLKQKGNDSMQVAKSLQCIGNVYCAKKQTVTSLQYYQRSLQIQIKLRGKDSTDVADALHNIGNVFSSKHDSVHALQYYQRALQIRMIIKGKESIDVANTFYSIGNAYYRAKDYHYAREFYEKCLRIKSKIKGKDSYDVADVYLNLGNVFCGKQDFVTAMDYYQRCLELRIKIKGESSKDVAETFYNMSILAQKMNDIKKSYEYAKKSYEIRKQILSDESQLTINSFKQMEEMNDRLNQRK